MKIKNYLRFFIFFSLIGLLLTFANNYFGKNSIHFMPKEYKTIKKLVDKIASKNYLGDKEIPFFIGSGRYMEIRAKELGLCKEDDCWYYNNLSPYKNYKNVEGINLNELIKQAYLFNGIEAYAWRGIVWLSQSTFRTYGEDNNFLNCTIGHELSHVVFDDYIEQNVKLSNSLKEINNQNKKNLNNKTLKGVKENIKLKLSRESEKRADINAAKMIINAGYPIETCIDELTFLAKSSKLDADTETDSTHPGFIERIASVEEFVNKYDSNREMREFKPYKWKWSYDSKSNILKFLPRK